MNDGLPDILRQFQSGSIDLTAAERLIRERSAEPLGFATVDHQRRQRCGAAEVIFAAGKTPAQVVAIAQAIRRRHPTVLITRATPDHVDAVRSALLGSGSSERDAVEAGSRGSTLIVGPVPPPADAPPIPIITAGTSDEPVAEEAELTCRALGQPVRRINDVGVAGLHRLGHRLPELREAAVVVCIAGMEGALPSVLGGLIDAPVIAVPTSTGYGAALGGVAALLGMLTSCASGVAVVNIDNGFGAAYTACSINRRLAR